MRKDSLKCVKCGFVGEREAWQSDTENGRAVGTHDCGGHMIEHDPIQPELHAGVRVVAADSSDETEGEITSTNEARHTCYVKWDNGNLREVDADALIPVEAEGK